VEDPMTLPDEIRSYLATLVDDDCERQRDHLTWLAQNPDEADRDRQVAECEQLIELARKSTASFAAE
jgi:hypothetical protein